MHADTLSFGYCSRYAGKNKTSLANLFVFILSKSIFCHLNVNLQRKIQNDSIRKFDVYFFSLTSTLLA